jgi:hypothetical protein
MCTPLLTRCKPITRVITSSKHCVGLKVRPSDSLMYSTVQVYRMTKNKVGKLQQALGHDNWTQTDSVPGLPSSHGTVNNRKTQHFGNPTCFCLWVRSERQELCWVSWVKSALSKGSKYCVSLLWTEDGSRLRLRHSVSFVCLQILTIDKEHEGWHSEWRKPS